MTYKKLKIVLALATVSFMTSAQKPKIIIYVKAIGGTYDMGAMKRFQELMADNYSANGQPAEVTSEFPFSVQAEAGVDFQTKSLTFGPWANFTQSKGELVYSNNSPTKTITNQLSRVSAGARVLKNVYKDFGIYGKVGLNETRLDNYKEYTCNGGTVELGCQWKYAYRHFRIITTVGYEAGANGKLRNFNSYEDDLKNIQEESVKVNWNGLRIGMGIGFSFAKTGNSKKPSPFIPKTIEVD